MLRSTELGGTGPDGGNKRMPEARQENIHTSPFEPSAGELPNVTDSKRRGKRLVNRGAALSRRHVAAGIAMLVATAAGSGVDEAQERDGELLGLCAEFRALEDELNGMDDALEKLSWAERRGHPLVQRESVGVDRIHRLRDLISELAARTTEGLRAKAEVALIDLGPDGEWPENNSQWIAWSLARDVLGKDV